MGLVSKVPVARNSPPRTAPHLRTWANLGRLFASPGAPAGAMTFTAFKAEFGPEQRLLEGWENSGRNILASARCPSSRQMPS